MQDLKMQDQIAEVENAGPENAGPPVNTANRFRYNEQTRKALLCHVCRHCCVHEQWLPDMQKPNTHGAASVPIKFRLTISVRTWLVT